VEKGEENRKEKVIRRSIANRGDAAMQGGISRRERRRGLDDRKKGKGAEGGAKWLGIHGTEGEEGGEPIRSSKKKIKSGAVGGKDSKGKGTGELGGRGRAHLRSTTRTRTDRRGRKASVRGGEKEPRLRSREKPKKKKKKNPKKKKKTPE